MNEEHMKKFHPELAEYYQKGDCCTYIVELRKQVSEKDKEIERLKNNIKELIELIDKEREHSDCLIDRNYKHLLKNWDQRTQIKHLQNLIGKTTNYYLKTLAKNESMPDEAVEMYNLLEENK